MSIVQLFLLFISGFFSFSLHARIKVENVADYHFGMVRAGYFPVKESTLWVAAAHYTLAIYGNSDSNLSFNLANGVHKVPYTVSWKDSSGHFAVLLPNTMSPVFNGTSLEKGMPATLQMQIKGNFPKPGHYSDTLTLIITPA